jgi:uncharacterized protein
MARPPNLQALESRLASWSGTTISFSSRTILVHQTARPCRRYTPKLLRSARGPVYLSMQVLRNGAEPCESWIARNAAGTSDDQPRVSEATWRLHRSYHAHDAVQNSARLGGAMTQIALFVVALFGVPWILNQLLPSPSGTLGSLLLTLIPSVWAPTVLAIIFIAAVGGVTDVRNELRARFRYRPHTGHWLFIACAVPIVVVGSAIVVARAFGDSSSFIRSSALPVAIALQVATGAVGEEFGWRGFLVSRLEARTGWIPAVWIMSALWSAWHVPAFFEPSLPHYTMPMGLVLAFILFFGAFMGLLFQRTGASILATIAAHLSLNIMTAIGGASLDSSVFWGVMACSFGVMSCLGTIWIRARIQSPKLMAPV